MLGLCLYTCWSDIKCHGKRFIFFLPIFALRKAKSFGKKVFKTKTE